MKIMGKYSLKDGEAVIQERFPTLLQEVEDAIAIIDSGQHQTKVSKEKT